ncbi:MAG: conserved rane protein of unknown function [Frankiales bacterium]|nr:conserved rane protein of unknown function [Frankiales bacterium]
MRRQRSDLLLLLPAGVLALLGSLLLLRRPSLWYDELFTAHVAPLPLDRIVAAVLSGEGTAPYLENVPPSYNAPYYVVVHGWLALLGQPPGELSLRSLSLLAGVLAVLVLTLAVTRLAGRAAGRAAGLLAAVNPLVLEYSVEARGYGLAMLATCCTALGLARWLDGRSLWPYAAGATAAGLAHWFALPVVAGLALSALLLRRRAALPLLGVTALAAAPALALVVLASRVDTAGTTTGWIQDTGGGVPWLSLGAWASKSPGLLVGTLVAVALATRARPRSSVVVGTCWVLVPVVVVTLAELVRPVFVPRYMLPGLLGLAVLAGVGLAGRWRGAGVVVLVGLSLFAAAPLASAPPRDDARGAVEAIAREHEAGQPVVAVDRRAALALEQYARGSVREDLLLPPDDAPPAEVVWLLRFKSYRAPLGVSDDDEQLRSRGFTVVREQVFDGSSVQMIVQRWSR